MKKLFGLLLAIAIVVSITPYARGLGSPSAPPGVAGNDWIPLGDAAGFVVTHGDVMPGTVNPPASMVRGYFMVRRANSWLRVDSAPDYGVHRTTMAR